MAPTAWRDVLIISVSNVGDAVLTVPALGRLRERAPEARVSVLCGQRAVPVYAGDPRIDAVGEYGSHLSGSALWALVRQLRRTVYDAVLDLRHTALPLLLHARRRTWPWQRPPALCVHMRDRHLWMLTALDRDRFADALTRPVSPREGIWVAPADHAAVDEVLAGVGYDPQRPLVVMSPSARSEAKRWPGPRFAAVAARLRASHHAYVVLTGEASEAAVVSEVATVAGEATSLAGRTTLRQLGALLMRARVLVTNDSAALHVAGSVGTPAVAIFGPTHPAHYGPRGPLDAAFRNNARCRECRRRPKGWAHTCTQDVSSDEVYEAVHSILAYAG